MKMIHAPLMAATLALGLTACGPKTEKSAATAANDVAETVSDIGHAASNTLSEAVDAVTPTPTGQQFADKAARGDAFEVAAAKLAVEHAGSPKVKAFARDVIAAHTESTARIKAAARKASQAITPDPTLTAGQNEKLADLAKREGADFDRDYLSGQIDAHRDALALMRDYAKNGEVAPLKAVAAAIAPIVQKHLDRAEALKG